MESTRLSIASPEYDQEVIEKEKKLARAVTILREFIYSPTDRITANVQLDYLAREVTDYLDLLKGKVIP